MKQFFPPYLLYLLDFFPIKYWKNKIQFITNTVLISGVGSFRIEPVILKVSSYPSSISTSYARLFCQMEIRFASCSVTHVTTLIQCPQWAEGWADPPLETVASYLGTSEGSHETFSYYQSDPYSHDCLLECLTNNNVIFFVNPKISLPNECFSFQNIQLRKLDTK